MKYLSTFWIFLVLAGTAAEPVFAADSPQQNLMQAAIDLGHRYDTTYGTKNPAAMAEIYAEDGVLISPAGPIVRGRDALAAYYAKRFASGAHDHSIKVLEVHVLGDGGYGINAFSVVVPKPDGTMHQEHGTIVAIYRHDPDGWHMSLVAPSVKEAAQ